MLGAKLFLVIYILHLGNCDWVSEWLVPVEDELPFKEDKKRNEDFNRDADEEEPRLLLMGQGYPEAPVSGVIDSDGSNDDAFSFRQMKMNLERTLQDAQSLVTALKVQIDAVTAKEILIKDAIINGRSGVTALTVSTVGNSPSHYIIRNGRWSLCNGVIHNPKTGTANTTPRCIGQEVSTSRDACAFNSVIKYETTPIRRTAEYYEDDFYCLKPTFNSTMEQYQSVARLIINSTCTNGIVRSLKENMQQCGIRMLSEYSYYPIGESSLPLEYCTGAYGPCNLMVGWHISNSTVENFEFLKKEPQFKKFFITNTITYDYEQLM